jgi:predicted NAD-dependent protein-ADP-ribosyltransferase YbiA (DUF1768 family)
LSLRPTTAIPAASVEAQKAELASSSAAQAAQAAQVKTVKLAPAPASAEKTKAAKAAKASKASPGLHTIPAAVAEGTRKKYSLEEIFQFYNDASQADKLKIGDPDAARWLSPSAPFPIKDLETDTTYPSVEHYIAGMKYKLATNKPELAKNLFSQEGEVHQSFLRTRATESAQGARALTATRDHELLKSERSKVMDESNPLGPTGMKKYRATFDEGKWFTVKDGVLREALRQRWEKDARLRKILEAVKAKGRILLYYTGTGSGSDLGGKRSTDGYIDGENKVGRILMELAGWVTY